MRTSILHEKNSNKKRKIVGHVEDTGQRRKSQDTFMEAIHFAASAKQTADLTLQVNSS